MKRMLCAIGALAVLGAGARSPDPGALGFALAWPAGALETRSEKGATRHHLRTRGAAEANLAVSDRFQAPADLRRSSAALRLRVDRAERLGGIELRAGAGNLDSYFAWSVPLFLDPQANLLQSGAWTRLSFGLADAQRVGHPDPARVDRVALYVADKGRPLEVAWQGLEWQQAPGAGVVTLTFDDGYDEHLDAARWMERYGFRGTAYVIPQGAGQPGYMTLAQLRELQSRYGWEVAAHHQTPFTAFDGPELEATLRRIRRFLKAHGFRGGAHLAYPLGVQNVDTVRPLVRRYFETARIAGGGFETLPPSDPHLLRVFNVVAQTPPEAVVAAARRAGEHGAWLILMFHYLVPEAEIPTEYAIADFRQMLAGLAATGVSVRPLGEVWRSAGGR